MGPPTMRPALQTEAKVCPTTCVEQAINSTTNNEYVFRMSLQYNELVDMLNNQGARYSLVPIYIYICVYIYITMIIVHSKEKKTGIA